MTYHSPIGLPGVDYSIRLDTQKARARIAANMTAMIQALAALKEDVREHPNLFPHERFDLFKDHIAKLDQMTEKRNG